MCIRFLEIRSASYSTDIDTYAFRDKRDDDSRWSASLNVGKSSAALGRRHL